MMFRCLLHTAVLLCALACSCLIPLSTNPGPPIAKLRVDPDTTCVDPIMLDASRSFDPDDSLAALQFRWDWQGDGIWDTALTSEAIQFLPSNIHTDGMVILQVRNRRGRSSTTVQPYWFDGPVAIRGVKRFVLSLGYEPCCRPTREGGCEECWYNDAASSDALGLWSAAGYQAHHQSFVSPERLWGIGKGREANNIQMEFDVCSPVLIRASNAGHRILLQHVESSETVWLLPESTSQELERILEPDSYFLRIDLYNEQERFNVEFLDAR